MLEIVRIVAPVATRALEDRVVIRVGMAGGTHSPGVTVTGWELRVLRVVERGSRPGCRVVAGLARSGEELRLCLVSRIRGVVVVRLVAAKACRWQCRVVVVHMAVCALPRRHSV